jgi:hypothetical protein
VLTFRIEFLLGPCALLALVLNHEFSTMEILWTFSIYLESVAILPQVDKLIVCQLPGSNENPNVYLYSHLGYENDVQNI